MMYAGLHVLGRCAARYHSRAYLTGANLTGADLTYADFTYADFAGANLTGADLTGADLTRATFTGANLTGANLTGAYLTGADLTRANLTGTCLDPSAPIPAMRDADIRMAGLTIEGEYVYGWRTRTSKHVGCQEYIAGETYIAPWFSVAATPCHPGLYLASQEWLDAYEYDPDRVRVRCLRTDLHKAGDKFRCRRLEVLS